MALRLLDKGLPVSVLTPRVANSPTTRYLSLKNYDRVTFVIHTRTGTSPTTNTFSLRQATNVSGAGDKALSFTTYHRWESGSGSDDPTGVLTAATTSSNAFTGAATANASSIYVIEVQRDQLDLVNNYDCVGLQVSGAAANATTGVVAVLHGPSYSGAVQQNPNVN